MAKVKLQSSSDKEIINKRERTLRVTCTKKNALSIVLPFVKMAAFTLSVEPFTEVEDTAGLKEKVDKAKTKIATLLSTKLGRLVEPQSLSSVSVRVLGGCQFWISVTEDKEDKNIVKQRFTLMLFHKFYETHNVLS